MTTLFDMLNKIYLKLDEHFYDDLTDYEKGLKDILNLLDTRMSGNNEEEMFESIIDSISKEQAIDYDYYYQIDFIDIDGCANYIDTFKSTELDKALEHVKILNNANKCLNSDTYFSLDKYRYQVDINGRAIDDTDELIEVNMEDK